MYFSLFLISGVSVFPVYSIVLKYKRHIISNSWYGYVEENISGKKQSQDAILELPWPLFGVVVWLGCRDSNPNWPIQSRQSYR
jgi:hypothetical protein